MVKALRKILFITRFFTFVSHNCEIFFYFKFNCLIYFKFKFNLILIEFK